MAPHDSAAWSLERKNRPGACRECARRGPHCTMTRHASFHMSDWNGFGLSVALLALGCGTQVSSGYVGEALLELRGSVVVDNPAAPLDLVPVLAFERPREGALSNTRLIEDVVHRGSFPARFELNVLAPPPAEAMQAFTAAGGGHVSYAWAQIGAVAPEHPRVLAQTNTRESSYCLGRECYTERARCDLSDDCYFERDHCSLPSVYDALGLQASLCREVATGGDVSAVPASPDSYGIFGLSGCDGPCELTLEWCSIPPEGTWSCREGTDDGCRPPPENCFSRTVSCVAETPPRLPPAVDEARWPERADLTHCGVVSRQGNLDYAANPNEWFAGLSDDVFVVYVEAGFDAPAFEEATGLPAPEQPGYSTFLMEPWSEVNTAAFQACSDREAGRLLDAYNLAHGTTSSAEEGVDVSTELGQALLLAMDRCSRAVGGSWLSDAGTELTLHVGLPPAAE
jgi:hypothetical protein